MKPVPLNRVVLLNRLAEIERDLAELSKLKQLGLREFTRNHHFAIAEHYLRRGLEAVFDASNHILSRFPLAPGQRPETYKAIARAMGRHKVVPVAFAEGPLLAMAGYRNRMIHFYHEITPQELHEILQHHLGDVATFAKLLRGVIRRPQRLGLRIR